MTVPSFEGRTPMIGEGCWVRSSADVAAAGAPARLLERPLDDDFRATWRGFRQIYVDLYERYCTGLGA